jgi:hypothetical protein
MQSNAMEEYKTCEASRPQEAQAQRPNDFQSLSISMFDKASLSRATALTLSTVLNHIQSHRAQDKILSFSSLPWCKRGMHPLFKRADELSRVADRRVRGNIIYIGLVEEICRAPSHTQQRQLGLTVKSSYSIL